MTNLLGSRKSAISESLLYGTLNNATQKHVLRIRSWTSRVINSNGCRGPMGTVKCEQPSRCGAVGVVPSVTVLSFAAPTPSGIPQAIAISVLQPRLIAQRHKKVNANEQSFNSEQLAARKCR